MYWKLPYDALSENERKVFTKREQRVLECIFSFCLFVYAKRMRSVEWVADVRQAVKRVRIIRRTGGRVSLYAARRAHPENFLALITPEMTKHMIEVDAPELPPLKLGELA